MRMLVSIYLAANRNLNGTLFPGAREPRPPHFELWLVYSQPLAQGTEAGSLNPTHSEWQGSCRVVEESGELPSDT